MRKIFDKSIPCYASFALAAISLTLPAGATDFMKITVTSYGDLAGNEVGKAEARAVIDDLMGSIETSINASFPAIDLVPFTKGTARSNAMASSGVGIDYASDFSFGFLGINVALATDATLSQMQKFAAGTASIEDAPGLAAVGALTLGLSFKNLPKIPIPLIDTSRGRGYLGFLTKSKTITPDDINQPSFTVGTTTFSAQGQYKLLEGKSVGLGMVKWGGVDLNGGLRYTKSSISITKAIPSIAPAPVDLDQGNPTDFGNAITTFAGNAIIDINASTFSLPVDVSTSVRLLHVLSLFVGTGIDLNFGGASSSLDTPGDLEITNDGGTSIGTVTADVSGNLAAKGSPGFLNLKYFGGVQVEVLAIAVSVQVAGSLTNSAKSVNLGAKAFW